jgi:hypothetical protein
MAPWRHELLLGDPRWGFAGSSLQHHYTTLVNTFVQHTKVLVGYCCFFASCFQTSFPFLRDPLTSHFICARCVRRTHRTLTDLPENEHQCHLDKILPTTLTLATAEKLQKIELCNFTQKMIGLQNIHKFCFKELE